MNLTEWARANGVRPATAYAWFKAGTLPVKAVRVNSRSIVVLPEDEEVPVAREGVGLYARVSSHDQKADLERQLARLERWSDLAGLEVVARVAEVGSGMNGSRTKLRGLLSDPTATVIVVEHQDRLGRMNTELVEAALQAQNRRVVVLEDTEVEDDLVRDMVEVLTSYCARLYGRRGAKLRAERAVTAAAEKQDD